MTIPISMLKVLLTNPKLLNDVLSKISFDKFNILQFEKLSQVELDIIQDVIFEEFTCNENYIIEEYSIDGNAFVEFSFGVKIVGLNGCYFVDIDDMDIEESFTTVEEARQYINQFLEQIGSTISI